MLSKLSTDEGSIPRIGYLTSQYPAPSHTFISREVSALHELGVDLHSFSIRAPHAEEIVDPVLAAEARRTWTVLSQPPLAIVSGHILALLTHPIRYSRLLLTALHHRPAGFKALVLAFAHFAEAVVLAAELKRRDITRLHNHFANSAGTVGFLAARFLSIPWSFTMHGISETDYPSSATLAAKIAAADRVVCASYFMRAQAMRHSPPTHWAKMHVIRCGVVVPRAAISSPCDRPEPTVICVARLSAEKGLYGLIDAFADLIRTRKCRLLLVGDGPERLSLERKVRELGLREQVTFLGRQPERATLNLIGSADVLVLASFMEGLPIVLMEAMAYGTPVIASQVAGVPELVENGVNGLLFAPSDWRCLADHLECLLSNAELRATISQNGRKTVLEKFTLERSAEELAKLFFETKLSSIAPLTRVASQVQSVDQAPNPLGDQ